MQFWTQNQFQNIFQREINQVKIYLKSIMKSKSILQCETKHACNISLIVKLIKIFPEVSDLMHPCIL